MRRNFTLLEMSVVLLIIISISSFVLSSSVGFFQRTTARSVEHRIKDIKVAIDGGRKVRDYDGYLIRNGFINDVGSLPISIDDLMLVDHDNDADTPPIPPAHIPAYTSHPLTVLSENVGYMGAGWDGPYLPTEQFSERLKDMIDDFSPVYDGGVATSIILSSPHIPSRRNTEKEIAEADLFVDEIEIELSSFMKDRFIDLSLRDVDGVPVSISPADLLETEKTLTIYYWHIKDGDVIRVDTHDLDQDSMVDGIQLADSNIKIESLPTGLMAFYVEYKDESDPMSPRVFQMTNNKAYKTYRRNVNIELTEKEQPPEEE